MVLETYRRKRNFQATPEPAGRTKRTRGPRQFVVQKHDASRLHYDFRLELDGVLKSWAVPKGPNPHPKAKSLAVEVEDHPLEYAGFEGTIPQGQYGGGTVMVWDQGTWEPEGDAERALRQGKLNFQLDGQKLHGHWTLVRMTRRDSDRGRNNWLLIKRTDDEGATNGKPSRRGANRSVLSGRTMTEIASARDRVWNSNREEPATASRVKAKRRSPQRTRGRGHAGKLTGARQRALPAKIKPQLATLVAEVPTGDDWLHELKYDGYRILARIDGERIDLFTRQGNNWTARFPAVVRALAKLTTSSAFLDGEIVALNEQGGADFQRLQNWMQRGDDQSLVCYVFDVPYLDGYDLCQTPLIQRKEALSRILGSGAVTTGGTIRFSDHVRGQGAVVVEFACQAGMEGIVSKRADGPYVAGRSKTWVKFKCLQRQEFVIGGYTWPRGSRQGFGSLLLGYYQRGKLHYAGHVGTGFTQQSLADMSRRLTALRTAQPPFENPPRQLPRQKATWVKPELVAEVEFSQWTEDGVLRHPSFKGLRDDKPAREITQERPAMTARKKPGKKGRSIAASDASRVAGVPLTHPDRVLYPELNLTKLDLALFAEKIADWILPHLANRPLTMVRCPGGREGQCFYQKHLAEKLPAALRSVRIKEKSGTRNYVVIDDLAGLVTLVQRGVLELHPWGAPADDLEHPDRLVIDLDPGEGAPWKAVIQAAKEVREYLEALELTSFVRTTGGKGLHVVVPLAAGATWQQHKEFAMAVAQTLAARSPEQYLATMSKAQRRGRIFIDYLRNQRGATSIASYSTRAREGAPVATPLRWNELTARLNPQRFTVATIPQRLAKLRDDPWDGFFQVRQRLTSQTLTAAKSVLAEVQAS